MFLAQFDVLHLKVEGAGMAMCLCRMWVIGRRQLDAAISALQDLRIAPVDFSSFLNGYAHTPQLNRDSLSSTEASIWLRRSAARRIPRAGSTAGSLPAAWSRFRTVLLIIRCLACVASIGPSCEAQTRGQRRRSSGLSKGQPAKASPPETPGALECL
jgi:hypothetical protein